MLKRKRDARTNANLTMKQAINLIAFDNVEAPVILRKEVQYQQTDDEVYLQEVEDMYGFRQIKLDEATSALFDALRDDEIHANGRLSKQVAQNNGEVEWTEQSYEGHSETRSKIPAEFWRIEGIDWESNSARSPNGEYTDIILSREKVLALWHSKYSDEEEINVLDRPMPIKPGRKRGPKGQYSRTEFLEICVLEAATNNLPEIQAEFIKQMDGLLSVLWGEDNVPGLTTLKKMISPIYKRRKKYEEARQRNVGE